MKSYAIAAAALVFTAILFGVAAPTLVSARDSIAVAIGLGLVLAYPGMMAFAWKAWRPLPESQAIITKIKGFMK